MGNLYPLWAWRRTLCFKCKWLKKSDAKKDGNFMTQRYAGKCRFTGSNRKYSSHCTVPVFVVFLAYVDKDKETDRDEELKKQFKIKEE